MPVLDLCDNFQWCGGMCEPPANLCPDCQRRFDVEKLKREVREAAKIQKTLDNLEAKPYRRPWWKVMPK